MNFQGFKVRDAAVEVGMSDNLRAVSHSCRSPRLKVFEMQPLGHQNI